jgi:MFS family permease
MVRKFSPQARLFLAAQFFFSIGGAAMWVLRNLYYRHVGFPESLIGTTLSVAASGAALVVLVLTPMLDRIRIKTLFLGGVALLSGGLVGVALFPDPLPAIGFCLLTGAGFAVFQICSAPIFTRYSTPEERPYLFGVGTALFPLAGIAATLGMKAASAFWGESAHSYQAMILIAALVVAFSLVFIVPMREERVPKRRRDEPPPVPLDRRTAYKFCGAEFVVALGAGLTIPFLNLYFKGRFQLDLGTIALVFGAAHLVQVFAFLLSPVVSSRFGHIRSIVTIQLMSIPFFFAMAFTSLLPLAVMCFLMRQACMNMSQPIVSNFMMDVVRPEQRVRVNAMKALSWSVAWIVATSFGGFVIENVPRFVDGYTTVMLVTIVLYVTASTMYWFFFRRQKPPEEAAAPGRLPPIPRG